MHCARVLAALAAIVTVATFSFGVETAISADVFTQCRKARSMNVRIRACTHIIKYHGTRQNRFLAHHDRGIAWWNKGNLKRALADFNAALRYRPNDADTRRHRADVLAEMRLQRKGRQQTQGTASPGRKQGARAAGKSLPRYERLIRQARRLFDRNRDRSAMKKLRQALSLLEKKEQKTELSIRERLLKAETLVLLDRPEPAMEIWRSLHDQLPPDKHLRDMLIELWHRLDNMGENAAKLEVGRLGVEASPSKADYHALYHLMLGAESMQEEDEMANAARRIIALSRKGVPAPDKSNRTLFLSRAHLILGNWLLAKKKLDEAEKAYREAARIDNEWAVPENNIGWIKLLKGQNEEAIQHFRKSIRLAPRYELAHGNLHDAWSNLGQHDKAAKALSRLIALNPSAQHYADRAWHLYLQGKLKQAMRDIRKAERIAPGHPFALAVKGLIQYKRGEMKRALDNIEKAIGKGQDWPVLHHVHGLLLKRAGKMKEAQEAFQRAISAKRPDSGEEPESLQAKKQARAELVSLSKEEE